MELAYTDAAGHSQPRQEDIGVADRRHDPRQLVCTKWSTKCEHQRGCDSGRCTQRDVFIFQV
jgi:hypothetical protein